VAAFPALPSFVFCAALSLRGSVVAGPAGEVGFVFFGAGRFARAAALSEALATTRTEVGRELDRIEAGPIGGRRGVAVLPAVLRLDLTRFPGYYPGLSATSIAEAHSQSGSATGFTSTGFGLIGRTDRSSPVFGTEG